MDAVAILLPVAHLITATAVLQPVTVLVTVLVPILRFISVRVVLRPIPIAVAVAILVRFVIGIAPNGLLLFLVFAFTFACADLLALLLTLLPMAANALYNSSLIYIPGLDWTPITFSLSGVRGVQMRVMSVKYSSQWVANARFSGRRR